MYAEENRFASDLIFNALGRVIPGTGIFLSVCLILYLIGNLI
jgi:hypothetical protein